MSFGNLTFTNRGLNLLSKGQSGTPIQITKIKVGDGQLGSSSILDLNDLKNAVAELNIERKQVMPSNQILISAVLRNQDYTSGFYLREFGIMANDPELGEILYAYVNAGTLADYIPAPSSAQVVKELEAVLQFGNASNVTITVNSLGMISKDMIDKASGVAGIGADGKIKLEFIPTAELNADKVDGYHVDDTKSGANEENNALWTAKKVKEITDGLGSQIGQMSNTRGYSNIPIITTDILLKNTNGWCRGINIPNAPIQNTWVFYRTVIMGDSFPWGYGFVRAYDYENKKEFVNFRSTSGWEGWREISTVNNISNPNLVINPDFRINQRGQAEYTFNVNSGCSVDRWVADPNFGIIKVIPNDGFLRLEQISIGTGSGFHAVKETIESSKNLSGKKVTLSCEYRNKAGSSQGMILIVSGNGVISQKPLPHSENWTKAQLTVELPQLTSDIAVWIYSDISKSLGYTDYRYVKLELGEIATPFSPRSYGEELELCQRYCFTGTILGTPIYNIDNNNIWFFIPFPISQRVHPTLKQGDLSVHYLGQPVSGFTVVQLYGQENGVRIAMYKPNHGLTKDITIFATTAIFDAEIY